jgi:hypothetical protein
MALQGAEEMHPLSRSGSLEVVIMVRFGTKNSRCGRLLSTDFALRDDGARLAAAAMRRVVSFASRFSHTRHRFSVLV